MLRLPGSCEVTGDPSSIARLSRFKHPKQKLISHLRLELKRALRILPGDYNLNKQRILPVVLS
jgi:hypothetical protein